MSRPARGAWIETQSVVASSRTLTRRAPRGARGLKLVQKPNRELEWLSRPARGAWIETGEKNCNQYACFVAPRAGRVD